MTNFKHFNFKTTESQQFDNKQSKKPHKNKNQSTQNQEKELAWVSWP